MGSMPLALSVHNFISSVGADAGFASIIGLAILVLLYFAHAKETANLHEEAEELAHRLLQAETRLAQLSRQQPVAAPAPTTAAPAPASQAARGAGSPIMAARAGGVPIAVPAAPVGVGAPALASATRMIPAITAEPDSEQDLAPDAEQAAAEQADRAVPAADREMAAAQAARAAAASSPVRERPAGPVAPTPATAAGAANGGNGERRVAAPVGVGGPPEAPPRPRVQIRSGAPSAAARRPPVPPRTPAPRRSRAGRRFVLLVGALIAVAAIAALVIITAGGGSSGSSRSRSGATTNAPGSSHRSAPPAFTPSSVTVAVLNGTATNELAHRVASKLTSTGYKQGTVATAPNQTQSATVVAYLPGFRNDALHVATALKLGPASVQAIDPQAQTVACPPPSSCTANVVVTVGADLQTL